MNRFLVLWHEPSNALAMLDPAFGGCPLITICDDDIAMVNPFFTYPLEYLTKFYGWHVIGEL